MKLTNLFFFIILFCFVILIVLPVFYIIIWIPLWNFEFNIFELRHIGLIRNSFNIAIGTSLSSLLIGVLTAFFIFDSQKYRKLFLIFCVIPIIIPTYIHAIVWNHLSIYIQHVGLDLHSIAGAIFILTLSYYSYIALLVYSGLENIDRNLIEAALLSSDRHTTLFKIILPLIFPHIFSGFIFVFIFSIIDFGVPDMLRLNVYPIEIFIQFSAFYNLKAAVTLSFPIIFFTVLFIFCQKIYMKNRSYIQIFGGIQTKSPTFFKSHIWMFIAPVFFCSSFLPIIVLIIKSGDFSNYLMVWSSSKNQLFYSIFISTISAMCILVFSFFIAYLIERLDYGLINNIIYTLSIIPLAIPATTVGICMIYIWNQPIIDFAYSNSLIIIFGYILRFIPFGVMIMVSGLKTVNQNLEESALLINSSRLSILYNITLPLLKPYLFVGFILIFILSFGELGTTVLILPPGCETIPVKIYNLIHYGAYEMVSALCLIFIFIIIVVSGVFIFLYKKLFRKLSFYDRSY